MFRCGSCGANNPDGALVCQKCGEATATVHPSYQGGGGVTGTATTGSATAVTASPSDLIAGRYRLMEMLGKGGAGVVYKAYDLSLREEIALKLLQMNPEDATADIERFKREIVTARKITAPNVIRIYDFGESGRDVFISMELLLGGTLTSRMRRGIPLAESLRIALGVCDGLAAAHDLGIIHRDLKPDNILFDSTDRPKIVDFGLARLASASTRTVGFSGTPFYMSPEQANGEEMTPQSDIYSLGVVLYHLFAGQLPFAGENLARLVNQHCNETPRSMRTLRKDLPESLDRAVMRALEKKPASRPSGVRALAAELRAVESAAGLSPTPIAMAASSPATLHGADRPKVRKPRAWLYGLGAMALLAIAGTGAAFVGGIGPFAHPTPAATPTITPPSTVVAAATTAAATPVETATATPTQVAVAPSPVPTVKPTAKPVTTQAVVREKDGVFLVNLKGPWVEISDETTGKSLGKADTDMAPIKLTPGVHRLLFDRKFSSGREEFVVRHTVVVEAGKRSTITINVDADPPIVIK